MRINKLLVGAVVSLVCLNANAIDSKYREKLERSGCTQVSEMQGCDINKTKAENAKAGYGSSQTEAAPKASTGHGDRQLTAESDEGQTVAKIRIDAKNQVWVNGKSVKAKHTGGALHFQQGMITYTVTDNPDAASFWMDTDAGTKGDIKAQGGM
jgi:hypothetical protein